MSRTVTLEVRSFLLPLSLPLCYTVLSSVTLQMLIGVAANHLTLDTVDIYLVLQLEGRTRHGPISIFRLVFRLIKKEKKRETNLEKMEMGPCLVHHSSL